MAQSHSQAEQDIRIQQLQDKVVQHDLQLAANEATVAWGFIVPLALIALKEVLQAVVFLRDRKDPESRIYRKDMFG
jgi:hypothetical protein